MTEESDGSQPVRMLSLEAEECPVLEVVAK
jgi:hypothetical protein